MERLLFLAIGFAQSRQASKECPASVHGIAEDHEETTDDGEVTEEEVEIEYETIT